MAVHSEDKHSQKENTKELDMNVVKEAWGTSCVHSSVLVALR